MTQKNTKQLPVWMTLKNPDGTEIMLANISLAELGFDRDIGVVSLYEYVQKECNLKLIDYDIIRSLRRQYKDQPKGEKLFMGEDLRTDREGDLYVTVIAHYEEGKESHSCCVENLYLEERWIFAFKDLQVTCST